MSAAITETVNPGDPRQRVYKLAHDIFPGILDEVLDEPYVPLNMSIKDLNGLCPSTGRSAYHFLLQLRGNAGLADLEVRFRGPNEVSIRLPDGVSTKAWERIRVLLHQTFIDHILSAHVNARHFLRLESELAAS